MARNIANPTRGKEYLVNGRRLKFQEKVEVLFFADEDGDTHTYGDMKGWILGDDVQDLDSLKLAPKRRALSGVSRRKAATKRPAKRKTTPKRRKK